MATGELTINLQVDTLAFAWAMRIAAAQFWLFGWCVRLGLPMPLYRAALWTMNLGLRFCYFKIGSNRWQRIKPPMRLTMEQIH